VDTYTPVTTFQTLRDQVIGSQLTNLPNIFSFGPVLSFSNSWPAFLQASSPNRVLLSTSLSSAITQLSSLLTTNFNSQNDLLGATLIIDSISPSDYNLIYGVVQEITQVHHRTCAVIGNDPVGLQAAAAAGATLVRNLIGSS